MFVVDVYGLQICPVWPAVEGCTIIDTPTFKGMIGIRDVRVPQDHRIRV
jgi:hypothetical protein